MELFVGRPPAGTIDAKLHKSVASCYAVINGKTHVMAAVMFPVRIRFGLQVCYFSELMPKVALFICASVMEDRCLNA